MSDGAKQGPPSLDEFSRRLDAARSDRAPEKNSNRASGAALGRAFRVGSELLAGLIVGSLLGLGLDTFFGTKPFLLLVGIFLGFAAGVLNVSRAFKASASDASDSGNNPSGQG
ncbi:MAG: AtpZ/AtpI family protein [Parvularculaceae bacterium]